MESLGLNSSDSDLIKNLKNTDPVYDTILYERPDDWDGNPDMPAKKLSVKKCALCHVVGKHNQENVTHENWCPWIWAIKRK